VALGENGLSSTATTPPEKGGLGKMAEVRTNPRLWFATLTQSILIRSAVIAVLL